MTVLAAAQAAYVAAARVIASAVLPAPVPACTGPDTAEAFNLPAAGPHAPVPQYRHQRRQSVELRLPCPACGVEVDWVGAVVEPGGATRYRFTGLCRCMIDDGVPA